MLDAFAYPVAPFSLSRGHKFPFLPVVSSTRLE